ncbi:cell division protein FtsL [Endozoicomonas ascidiicola]|uniref:cell division protein FtsL n=1 Tax=Endozoicomonas ascidiicola TaxID=1698521 RepID=UPI0008348B4F|nr:cell division protein FtsL [Endozoicomonas ascidiicola]
MKTLVVESGLFGIRIFQTYALPLVLLLLVVISGLAVGYVSYENRRLHNRMQQEFDNKNNAQIEWGRLLLEHSTLTAPARVEKIARSKLGMDVPANHQIEMVLP